MRRSFLWERRLAMRRAWGRSARNSPSSIPCSLPRHGRSFRSRSDGRGQRELPGPPRSREPQSSRGRPRHRLQHPLLVGRQPLAGRGPRRFRLSSSPPVPLRADFWADETRRYAQSCSRVGPTLRPRLRARRDGQEPRRLRQTCRRRSAVAVPQGVMRSRNREELSVLPRRQRTCSESQQQSMTAA
jgi:hypothetical protein